MDDVLSGRSVANPLSGGTDQLANQIHSRMGRRIRDFRVFVQDAGLVLRGQSNTFFAKQMAQHTAMQVTGLQVLANEIEVR